MASVKKYKYLRRKGFTPVIKDGCLTFEGDQWPPPKGMTRIQLGYYRLKVLKEIEKLKNRKWSVHKRFIGLRLYHIENELKKYA